jgi:hypothetical protein
LDALVAQIFQSGTVQVKVDIEGILGRLTPVEYETIYSIATAA